MIESHLYSNNEMSVRFKFLLSNTRHFGFGQGKTNLMLTTTHLHVSKTIIRTFTNVFYNTIIADLKGKQCEHFYYSKSRFLKAQNFDQALQTLVDDSCFKYTNCLVS